MFYSVPKILGGEKAMNIKEKLGSYWAYFLSVFAVVSSGKLWTNTRGEMNAELLAPITILLGGIVWTITIPIFVDQVASTNTDAWDFTGSEGAIVLYSLTPFAMITREIKRLVSCMQDRFTGSSRKCFKEISIKSMGGVWL